MESEVDQFNYFVEHHLRGVLRERFEKRGLKTDEEWRELFLTSDIWGDFKRWQRGTMAQADSADSD